MAEFRTSDTAATVGRKKLWPVRLTLPMTDEMLERLDAARGADEARLDVIREAIERELKRRERQQG